MAVAAGCQTYPPTSFQVCGRIRDKYNQTGGPAGFLLFPKSNELTNPGNTGKRTEFVGGNIYWSAATDAHPVAHEFLTKWGEKGYESGYLKYPTTDEIVLGDGTSRRQEYQGGSIYFAFGIGAHTIQGTIRDKWRALGAENSFLGFPTSDEKVSPDGKGRYNTFQHGSIYWSPTTGAHPVSGNILDRWAEAGYERGEYGYPTGDATPVQGTQGAYNQKFQNGWIYVEKDNLFQGLISPVDQTVAFKGYDTQLHPNYCQGQNTQPTCPVDLSEYDTLADPLNEYRPQNRALALGVSGQFELKGRTYSQKMWDHMYDNTGADFQLPIATVTAWAASTHNNYNQPDVGSYAPMIHANREKAIRDAIAEADRLGRPAKVVTMGDDDHKGWQTVAGDDPDHVQSMGRHQAVSTTAVIAQPGTSGNHQVQVRQKTHVYDVYDFHQQTVDEWGDLKDIDADTAVNVGWAGIGFGIAKPFLSYGSSSEQSASGVR